MSNDIYPAAVMIVFILTAGGTILLRPVVKKLGDYLEFLMTQEKSRPAGDDVARLREAVDTLSARLALVEERQDFAESMLSRPEPPRAIPVEAPR